MTDSSLTPDIRTRLAQIADVTLDERTTFAELTTLHLGGRPRLTVRCGSTSAVAEVVMLLDAAGIPLLVVGGGSNLVVAEGDLDLVAVILENDTLELDPASGLVRAGAGAVWDDVVAATVEAGLGGIECLSGIPGSTGATPVQNVGAYGAEIADVLTRVLLLERATGEVSWVPAADLELAYRYSNLKFTGRGVVLAIELQLNPDGLSAPLRFGELARRLGATDSGGRRPVTQVRDTVLDLRRGKGMVLAEGDHDTWSAGSFFTNPVVDVAVADSVQATVRAARGDEDADRMPRFPAGEGTVKLSAAWLIDRAGFAKGHPGEDAPARLSTRHTLALTNRGSASTSDLVALAREVRDGVRGRFGVTLVPEPVWIGVSID
ncbi:UDP-N-acetylmuramate dehydrogenase [Corynebacterium comes]|uniref:UDP-N-acetylenolpyruvoylglucosamine reductase n=1 Tax=Corynebacterium comes TaxID=2675218 RepID=A0A6B8VXC6_9CORY|nr:UDP-N-acetylmuramate dehydrogenase [Corynebacterium comes]QGU03645.1 UDP-N-acetylenolpyruvoylglucosamine reductase [Corynebacterium comes]